MPGWKDLAREYEARRYPPTRRLDLQGEGPATARERALRWLQTFAHEQPGADLLLIVERVRVHGRTGPVRAAIERLLNDLQGRLIERWSTFGEGSLAVRIAAAPNLAARAAAPLPDDAPEGRTAATDGAVTLAPEADIPPELLPLARHAAELRRTREGLALSVLGVVLREIWIEAQAAAMTRRIGWEAALREILHAEQARAWRDEAD